ncbi:MAG: hypothetical protein ACREJC_15230 [Tepidisphaeraceae bacterium]
MKPIRYISLVATLILASCARVSVDPVEVKPIHIVMDVNIRVDRELDQFFAFENAATRPTTQPAQNSQPQAASNP